MNKKTVSVVASAITLHFQAYSQFNPSDVVHYVGSGEDTALCVVDFLSEGGSDTAYAWGFLFDAEDSVTAKAMLEAIAADEPQLTFGESGNAIESLTYNRLSGTTGTTRQWKTWHRTATTSWAENAGTGEVLANGIWWGCSFTTAADPISPRAPLAAYASTSFQKEDVAFWVGTGSDSAVAVIDFVKSSTGEQVAYAWGYVFNGPTDARTMLTAIAAADAHLTVTVQDGGSVPDSVVFNALAGKKSDTSHWVAWSGTNLSDWVSNEGLSTRIEDGDWWGCTYVNPLSRRPFAPSAAQDPTAFTPAEHRFFYGTGADTATIVIDFNAQGKGASFAFGYAFDAGEVTGGDALRQLDTALSTLTVAISGGFLNDIRYEVGNYSGVGGNPNYWSTWSAKRNGGWSMNGGLSEVLADGDWWGCSYTDFSPAEFPSTPIAANPTVGIAQLPSEWRVYPNPTRGMVALQADAPTEWRLYDLSGKLVMRRFTDAKEAQWNLSSLEKGLYQVVALQGGKMSRQSLVKY